MTKKKVQKKATKKKTYPKAYPKAATKAKMDALYAEMSSVADAGAPGPYEPATYTWKAYTPDEASSPVVYTALIMGTLLGSLGAFGVLLLTRLFS